MPKRVSYRPLITKWEAFLELNKGTSLQEFAHYILELQKSDEGNNPYEESPQHDYPYLTAEAGRVIFRLYKFSRIYTKPILSEAGLNSFEEFSILTTLLSQSAIPKKLLITENLIEFTTGMDMLKRMSKQKLIIEQINPDDKRERLVSLSHEGRTVLMEILTKFQTIEDVLGDLNNKEREKTIEYLERLDLYHSSLFQKNN